MCPGRTCAGPHWISHATLDSGAAVKAGTNVFPQTLLQNDLVDELWLKIFPITIGSGQRLFENGTIPAAFEVADSKTSPLGVIVATFKRAGELKTGSF